MAGRRTLLLAVAAIAAGLTLATVALAAVRPVAPSGDALTASLVPALALIWAAGHLMPHGPRTPRRK